MDGQERSRNQVAVAPSRPAAPAMAAGVKDTVDEGEETRKGRGGRRPYDEILEENEALRRRVDELKAAAEPFGFIPDDGSKPAEAVLYRLVRNGADCPILCGQIRRLRRALGMP